jgi:hypothetical protein
LYPEKRARLAAVSLEIPGESAEAGADRFGSTLRYLRGSMHLLSVPSVAA